MRRRSRPPLEFVLAELTTGQHEIRRPARRSRDRRRDGPAPPDRRRTKAGVRRPAIRTRRCARPAFAARSRARRRRARRGARDRARRCARRRACESRSPSCPSGARAGAVQASTQPGCRVASCNCSTSSAVVEGDWSGHSEPQQPRSGPAVPSANTSATAIAPATLIAVAGGWWSRPWSTARDRWRCRRGRSCPNTVATSSNAAIARS